MNTSKKAADKVPLSNFGRFVNNNRGKEFVYKGRIICKAEAFAILSRDNMADVWTRQKPGWRNGRIVDGEKYREYLSTIIF